MSAYRLQFAGLELSDESFDTVVNAVSPLHTETIGDVGTPRSSMWVSNHWLSIRRIECWALVVVGSPIRVRPASLLTRLEYEPDCFPQPISSTVDIRPRTAQTTKILAIYRYSYRYRCPNGGTYIVYRYIEWGRFVSVFEFRVHENSIDRNGGLPASLARSPPSCGLE